MRISCVSSSHVCCIEETGYRKRGGGRKRDAAMRHTKRESYLPGSAVPVSPVRLGRSVRRWTDCLAVTQRRGGRRPTSHFIYVNQSPKPRWVPCLECHLKLHTFHLVPPIDRKFCRNQPLTSLKIIRGRARALFLLIMETNIYLIMFINIKIIHGRSQVEFQDKLCPRTVHKTLLNNRFVPIGMNKDRVFFSNASVHSLYCKARDYNWPRLLPSLASVASLGGDAPRRYPAHLRGGYRNLAFDAFPTRSRSTCICRRLPWLWYS